MQYSYMRRLNDAKSLLIVGLLASLVFVACSSDDESPAAPRPTATARPAEPTATASSTEPAATASSTEPAAVESELSGEIVIDGSSTVYPVSVAAAEDFRIEHPGVQIPVGISGTGGGFKKFAAGEIAISDASRPIKDSERELASENGVEFIELSVAFDGLSVLVNPDNDWTTCLTTDQLNAIWEPESTITNWNQVDPSFPDVEIVLYGPDADSGTFDYFTEEINGDTGIIRDDFFPAVDDNVLVQGIAGDRGSLGYFGYAYYASNADQVEAGGCRLGFRLYRAERGFDQ